MQPFLGLLGTAVLLSFSGCSTTIGNLEEYKPIPLEPSKFIPESFDNEKPKVVVFELSNGNNQSAINADIGMTTATELEKYLNESGSVETVDRNAAEKLKGELQLIEMGSDTPYSGPAIASYAISGSISNAGMSSKFIEAVQYIDKNGKMRYIPPACIYIANVSGLLKIYELPSMKIALSRPFSETKRQSENGRSARDCGRMDDASLIRSAAVDAAEEMRHDLKNFFAKKAYISEKRLSKNGKTAIFKIEFGTNDGAKTDDTVEIYTLEENYNPLRKVTTQEEVKIAEAKISKHITQNVCWILIDDPKIAEKVKLGDYVKLHYEKSFLDTLKNSSNMFNKAMNY